MKTRLRASVVCEANGHLLVVRLRDPVTGVEALYPPGGGIEPDEKPEGTATREALEETGLHVRVNPDISLIKRYPFRWGPSDYDVTTHYFAATLEDEFNKTLPTIKDADYNLGAAWIPTSEAIDAMMSVHPVIGSAVLHVTRLTQRASWAKHPNFSGPASTLQMIHEQFRRASERLLFMVDRDDDLGWVGRAFEPLAQTLHHHHHAEEAMLFPMVLKRTGTAPERLVSDHQELTSAIDAVGDALHKDGDRANAKEVAARFHDVLITHLDREEMLVTPVLLSMRPDEAWALIHDISE